MRRLRMTVVYDFDWEAPEMKSTDADALVRNFLKDPTAFLNISGMAVDEALYIDLEDISDRA